MPYIVPFLEQRALRGAVVTTEKGRLSRELQLRYGDFLINRADTGEITAIDAKAERTHTGNLFLETWSNRASRRPGWLYALDVDLLLYFFLDRRTMYSLPFQALTDWAFGKEPGAGRLWSCRETRQKAYEQHNDTWGRLVEAERLVSELGGRTWDLGAIPTGGRAIELKRNAALVTQGALFR